MAAGNGNKALFGGNGQRYADRVPAAEHERHGRLFHARDQLSDGKSGLHIAADRVEQNQQTVDFVGLLNCRNLRDEVLVLGGFVLCGSSMWPSIWPTMVMQCIVPRDVFAVIEPVSRWNSVPVRQWTGFLRT